MTVYCIVCKKEPTPKDSPCFGSRSFHKFPVDKKLRDKWMKAVEVQSITTYTRICSDHFYANDFHESTEYTRVRRLLSTAVPFSIKKPLCNITNIEDQEQFILNVPSTSEGRDKIEISDLSVDVDSISNNCTNDLYNTTQNLQKEDVSSIQNHCNKSNKNSKNSKRSQTPIDVSDIPLNKKFRFVDGCQPTHLSREDFTSDEAWTRFLKYTIFKDRQLDASRKKNQRQHQKIANINELVVKLREDNANDAEDYLQGLPDHVKELISRMKNNKSTSPFPAHLKSFSRSLHYHSPAAYEMIRNSFMKCLPCVETLNRWNCSRNYKPGISEEIVNHVAKMVKNELEKEKKLFFNFTFDEMSIKEWTYYCQRSKGWRGFVDLWPTSRSRCQRKAIESKKSFGFYVSSYK